MTRKIQQISIHTPAKGVTDVAEGELGGFIISIHTPAKGVTCFWTIRAKHLQISIHTPAKGVTNRKEIRIMIGLFQSTLPRRE
ncbi:hypothetical protein RUMGNA_03720 [Mediterraneibacter gnavus ATCC 29149]|uniref:Uncharacterized protein n=1 Tax=Mediterraneibacter gnavus (strain ATCC 29149 / DSM 114966 / JCM 6515 / VPI C7-9) TaxID=411470 RepID=A7B805_MEDG7|nr:hypothetical protein RUMGNA_03720 [Mediterraneibacter gnavus ATCC 29149]